MCPAPERIDEKPTAGVGDAPVDDATVKAWDLREGNTRKDMGASVESSWRESDAVEEKTAGIELYANAAAGFDGVLKERFSDFIVREIDKDTGKAVRLDDLSAAVDVPIDARERAKFDEMKARVLAMEKEAGLSEDKGDESEEGEGDDQIDEDAMTEFEALCGARLLYNYIWPGGVSHDLPPKFIDRTIEFLDYFDKKYDEYNELLTGNPIFIERTADVGVIPVDVGVSYGVTGPSLRGSGVDYDLRKTEPYSIYEKFDFDIPVGEGKMGTVGDCWDRYWVRMLEMKESMKIIRKKQKVLNDF